MVKPNLRLVPDVVSNASVPQLACESLPDSGARVEGSAFYGQGLSADWSDLVHTQDTTNNFDFIVHNVPMSPVTMCLETWRRWYKKWFPIS